MSIARTAHAEYVSRVNSGRALRLVAGSHESADRMNYEPMMMPEEFGRVIEALGRAAQIGEPFDYAVAAAIHVVGPFQNRRMASRAIARALAEFIEIGWHDTRTATGPNPGMPSTHNIAAPPRVALVLTALAYECQSAMNMAGATPGWALQRMIAENADVHRIVRERMPRVAAKIASS